MVRSEILTMVNDIFKEVLEDNNIMLTDKTTTDDAEFDSLSRVPLIVAIEKAFKIKFTSHEILSWENIGEMVDAIEKKL